MSDPDQRSGTTDGRTDRDRRGDRVRRDSEALQWISGAAALIGLWIAVSPFLYETTEAVMWNNVAVGAAIFVIAAYNFYRELTGGRTSVSVMSLVALLGLWAVVAPLVLAVESQALLWSNVITGVAVALLSGYVVYAASDARTGTPAGMR